MCVCVCVCECACVCVTYNIAVTYLPTRLLQLLQPLYEVPESRASRDSVWGKYSHAVQGRVLLRLSRYPSPYHLVLLQLWRGRDKFLTTHVPQHTCTLSGGIPLAPTRSNSLNTRRPTRTVTNGIYIQCFVLTFPFALIFYRPCARSI